jgi:hypothetical protein
MQDFKNVLVTEDMIGEMEDMNAQCVAPRVCIPGIDLIIPLVVYEKCDNIFDDNGTREEVRDRLVAELNEEIENRKKSLVDFYVKNHNAEPDLCLLLVRETMRLELNDNGNMRVWAELGMACINDDMISPEFSKWYDGI